MGGSHLAADLLGSLLAQGGDEREIRVWSSDGVPPWAAHYDLTILSSYSGETEEVLSAWEEGRQRTLPLAVVSAGGRLLTLAQHHNVPFVTLPKSEEVQPRVAVGWSAQALTALCGWNDVQEALIEAGQTLQRENVASLQEEANRLASALVGKVVACYAPSPYGSVAYFWKIFLNETGKTLAWSGEVPEINHNEMEGFDTPPAVWAIPPENLAVLILLPTNVSHRVSLRLAFLERVLQERGVETRRVAYPAGVWGVVWFGMWVSLMLARARRVDPFSVPLIQALKTELKREKRGSRPERS